MKRFALIDKAFLLNKTELFASIDLDDLLPIADKLSQAHFEPGQEIFQKGDQALRMYFVAKGSVELLQDKDNPFATLSENAFFGEESLFNHSPRAYTARAQTEVVVLSISRTNLMTIISECPSVAVGLLNVYATAFPVRTRS